MMTNCLFFAQNEKQAQASGQGIYAGKLPSRFQKIALIKPENHKKNVAARTLLLDNQVGKIIKT